MTEVQIETFAFRIGLLAETETRSALRNQRLTHEQAALLVRQTVENAIVAGLTPQLQLI